MIDQDMVKLRGCVYILSIVGTVIIESPWAKETSVYWSHFDVLIGIESVDGL